MMRILKISFLSGLLLLPASFTSVHAAVDEFGARFTNQAPVALGVNESDALLATQDSDLDGMSAEDLNAIAPAAGNASATVTDDKTKNNAAPAPENKAAPSAPVPTPEK